MCDACLRLRRVPQIQNYLESKTTDKKNGEIVRGQNQNQEKARTSENDVEPGPKQQNAKGSEVWDFTQVYQRKNRKIVK